MNFTHYNLVIFINNFVEFYSLRICDNLLMSTARKSNTQNFYLLKFLISVSLVLASFNFYREEKNINVEFVDNQVNFVFGNFLSPRCNLNHFSLLITKHSDLAAPLKSLSIYRSCLCKVSLKNKPQLLLILLLLSGDIELNPGPPRPIKFPCGICKKACKWGQRAIACDECQIWYHTDCAFLSTFNYDILANCSLSWCCLSCGLPNFSSSLFESSIAKHPNRYETLNHLSQDSFNFNSPDPSTNNFNPKETSTPKHKRPRYSSSRSNPDYNTKSNTSNYTNISNKPSPEKSSSRPQLQNQRNNTLPSYKSKLNCLVINFQSLYGKKEELSNLVSSINIDILIGTETWLNPDILNSELLMNDFDIYRRDRINRGGGGCLIAIKKHFTSEFVHQGEFSESLFCKINVKGGKPIIIGCVYRPPDRNAELTTKICEDISLVINKHKNSVFWLGGDFNLPDIEWENEEIENYQYPKEISNEYLQMSANLGLKQLVREPTRGVNCLDLFFTNTPDLTNKCSIIPGLSDHEAVLVETKLKLTKKKPVKRNINLWKKVNEEKLRKECNEFKTSFLNKFDTETDVNDLWENIKSNLLELMKNNVPTKTASTKHHQPWITTTTKRLIRKKHRWLTKSKRSKSNRVRNKYNEIKRICQRTCRKAHINYLNDLFIEDNNKKKLWTYIKNKGQQDCGISDLRNVNGILFQNAEDKANILNDQFCSVFSDPTNKINHTTQNENRLPDMKRIKVTRAGVLKLLLNINPNKATGPDNIPGRLLKLCAYELADIFTLLFQSSLNQGKVPHDWKKAHIMPLFKKGERTNAENYRPVSLTSIASKLLEHIIHSNIMDHLDRFDVLKDSQHGFRQKRSCESQLITTINDFSECLNSKGQIDAVLLDFSKAFDKVDHEGLIFKLENLGVRHSLLFWIKSFLIGREQRVLVDGKQSSSKPVLSGVPQGTVLGPLLFLIYINDISNKLSPGTSIRLFADDSLLYRRINNPSDSVILQNDLNKLQSWEQEWKMEFHPGKCQLLRITNKSKQFIPSDYFIHHTKLEMSDSAKYLGVIIDSRLNWKYQCQNVCKKANKVLAFLRRNIHSCPPHIKNHCVNSLVKPVLEYGSVVWDPHQMIHKEKLEEVQKRAARFVTGNYIFEHGNTKKNMKKLEWEPLEERRARSKVTTFFKARQKLIEIPLNHLNINVRNRRKFASHNYAVPVSTIDSHLHSFYPSTIRLWNRLPAELHECADTEIFKSKLNKITLRASYN